jgi:hypothetical protein
MSKWHASVTTAALICGLTVFTSASQRSGTPQVFRVRTDLVQVDVSVLDKRRQPVRGLQAEDFTLLEDSKPRPVAAFTAVELPAQAAAPKAPWMRGVPSDVSTNDFPDEGRLVVILMDRTIPFGLPAATAHNVAKAAIEQLSPGDLAAVVYTGTGTPQDFTSDQARLLTAIGGRPEAGVSRETSDRWVDQRDQFEAGLWIDPPRPLGAPLISVPGFIPRIMPGENDGECYCGLCVLNSIRTVADALRD